MLASWSPTATTANSPRPRSICSTNAAHSALHSTSYPTLSLSQTLPPSTAAASSDTYGGLNKLVGGSGKGAGGSKPSKPLFTPLSSTYRPTVVGMSAVPLGTGAQTYHGRRGDHQNRASARSELSNIRGHSKGLGEPGVAPRRSSNSLILNKRSCLKRPTLRPTPVRPQRQG
jgi:hypothetical protein